MVYMCFPCSLKAERDSCAQGTQSCLKFWNDWDEIQLVPGGEYAVQTNRFSIKIVVVLGLGFSNIFPTTNL